MSVKYTVGSNGLFVHAIAYGVLIPDDIHQHIKDISQDDSVKSGFCELFDVSEITESKINPEIFREIRELILYSPKKETRQQAGYCCEDKLFIQQCAKVRAFRHAGCSKRDSL